jgi:hypothetical protein
VVASAARKEENVDVDGKRFVALREIAAKCVVIFSPRVSDMGEVVLQAGEAFKVVSTHDDMVSCRPLRYAAVEEALIAAETRAEAGYKGYGLVISRAALDGDCAPYAEVTDLGADR